jgi:hypothetical protein
MFGTVPPLLVMTRLFAVLLNKTKRPSALTTGTSELPLALADALPAPSIVETSLVLEADAANVAKIAKQAIMR